MSPHFNMHLGAYVVLTALAGCSQVSRIAPVGADVARVVAGVPRLSEADEVKLAQHSVAEFERGATLSSDPLLEAYVTQVMQRIVAVANPRSYQYRVKVIDDPTINAFTFGGGFIYFYSGLLARLENEAQFAMIMGHEIAHVTERHVPRGMQGRYGAAILIELARATSVGEGVVSGSALEKARDYMHNAAQFGHNRSLENEADAVGLGYMTKAGFDPTLAAGAFQMLLDEHGDPPAARQFFYGSHPTNRERITKLGTLAAELPSRASGSENTRGASDEYQRRTRTLVVKTAIDDFEKKRFRTASKLLLRTLPWSEGDPVPSYYLGLIALETGGVAGADSGLRYLRISVSADSTYAPAVRELGVAYYRKGEKSRSIAAFEQYLLLAPKADDAARVSEMIRELRRG